MRKRLALATALFLITSGIALAQQDMGNKLVDGSTFLTGVVEARSSNALTVREDSGAEKTVLYDSGTVGIADFSTGDRVRVDYRMNDSGQAVAEAIQGVATEPQAVVVAQTQMPTEPAVAPAPAPEPEAIPEPAAPVETAPAPAPQPQIDSELPKTASPLYGLALIGLLGVSAAAAVRFTH